MKSTLLLVSLMTLAGATHAGTSQSDVDAAIAAAVDANKKAASVGGEWRDAGKIINSARAAAEAGDADKAVTLAEKARFQGDAGYQQAMAERKHTTPSYLK